MVVVVEKVVGRKSMERVALCKVKKKRKSYFFVCSVETYFSDSADGSFGYKPCKKDSKFADALFDKHADLQPDYGAYVFSM